MVDGVFEVAAGDEKFKLSNCKWTSMFLKFVTNRPHRIAVSHPHRKRSRFSDSHGKK